jgi:hypothetical protein
VIIIERTKEAFEREDPTVDWIFTVTDIGKVLGTI